MLVFL